MPGRSLGISVFTGLLASTLLAVVFVPAFFRLYRRIDNGFAFGAPLAGHLDDQDSVFGRQGDQQHQADLHIEISATPRGRRPDLAAMLSAHFSATSSRRVRPKIELSRTLRGQRCPARPAKAIPDEPKRGVANSLSGRFLRSVAQ
jgi:hypothetical protein